MRPPPPPPPSSRRAPPQHQKLRPAAGVVVAGKYQLTRLLRHGGMGSVWVATHLALEVPVAIKFMTANLASDARARFAREAKSAAQIRGANVVQILDHGIDRELPYIVMELLDGEDLGARLHRLGRLSLVDVARVLAPVSRALERAHEKGLVHRDLKPENIFIAREGDMEVPKVLDFGIAKAVRGIEDEETDGTTREGALIGTPYFMSPEQARGRLDVDHRSDLWSLGVIAFRAVVGVKPFTSRSMADVIVQICADPIPRPSALCPDLPPAVDAFFERALARDPNLRFQTARELNAAFSDLLPSTIRAAHELTHATYAQGGPPAPGIPGAAPSWPSASGPMGTPHPSGPWPSQPYPLSASASGFGADNPHAGPTPAPPISGYGSWPGAGSGANLQRTGDRTGGTLAHGVQYASVPAAPAKTPWVLLGTLATIAAVTLTAAGIAFFQSRQISTPSAVVEPSNAAPVAAAPGTEPAVDPTSAPDAAPATAATASASASAATAAPHTDASPKKLAPKASAAPPSTKRDLGY